MGRLTIGSRLTLWYGGILAVGLSGFAIAVYSSFSRNLLSEIDRALAEELAEIAAVVQHAPNRAALAASLERSFASHEFYEIQVTSADDAVVFRTARLGDRRLPAQGPIREQQTSFSVELAGLGPHRVAARVMAGPAGEFVIHAADSLNLYRRELASLLAVMLGAGPLVVGIGLIGGYWLSRRALAPVDRLAAAAIAITATRLDRRVNVAHSDDELGRLASAFNGMIARLERSFDEMRRFTADAAHELRTPLAVLRSEAEVALRSERTAAQHRQVLENQLEEIARLSRLTEELLILCREDAGLEASRLAPVRVDETLGQLVFQLQAAAQARDVSLSLEAAAPVVIASDPDRLRRLIFNVIDNALKYTPAKGHVQVRCEHSAGKAEITVTDTGPGIPAEHLPHLCERFYRVDQSRGRTVEGTGLGLSICQAIVLAHRGNLRFECPPGGGTRVVVSLPVLDRPSRIDAPGHLSATPPPGKTSISGRQGEPGDGVRVETHCSIR